MCNLVLELDKSREKSRAKRTTRNVRGAKQQATRLSCLELTTMMIFKTARQQMGLHNTTNINIRPLIQTDPVGAGSYHISGMDQCLHQGTYCFMR